jgi:hypothetical protein
LVDSGRDDALDLFPEEGPDLGIVAGGYWNGHRLRRMVSVLLEMRAVMTSRMSAANRACVELIDALQQGDAWQ